MDKCCKHIREILDVERKIIIKHIEKHKWFNHFEFEHDAITDFVNKYAWLMREVFCGALCPHREVCQVSEKFRKAFLSDISDGEINKYIKQNCDDEVREIRKLKLQVLKNDLKKHKWLNQIDNYPKAVDDFLNKFGWLIYEMYKCSKEKYEGE